MSHFTLSPVASQIIKAINESGNIAEVVSSLDLSDRLSEKEQVELNAALGTIDKHLHTLLGYAIA